MNSVAELRRKRLICLAIITGDKFLKSTNLNNSDTDEEIDTIFLTKYLRKLREARKKPLRIRSYVDRTVPGLTTKQFCEHFRMSPDTYEILEEKLGILLIKENHSRRPTIFVRKQLLSTLWFLATPDSYR